MAMNDWRVCVDDRVFSLFLLRDQERELIDGYVVPRKPIGRVNGVGWDCGFLGMTEWRCTERGVLPCARPSASKVPFCWRSIKQETWKNGKKELEKKRKETLNSRISIHLKVANCKTPSRNLLCDHGKINPCHLSKLGKVPLPNFVYDKVLEEI